jgi:hypothetical protein
MKIEILRDHVRPARGRRVPACARTSQAPRTTKSTAGTTPAARRAFVKRWGSTGLGAYALEKFS